MKKITIGILAHVDSGKTTLSEALLYKTGQIVRLGRVDHKDAFLDFDNIERQRGITVYSKQAVIEHNNCIIHLLDTPGHVDFSTEMERTLQVLDYAILLINGVNGVQSHSQTIWKLLDYYAIPTFVFINKIDITHFTQEQLMGELLEKLSPTCIDFTQEQQSIDELVALSDENYLDEYMNELKLKTQTIKDAISTKKVTPCYFGSALKLKGIQEFLDGITNYTNKIPYPDEFGARIFKITYENNQRLAHVKITGGTLKVKEKINNDEKVDSIRQYSGNKYISLMQCEAGDICTLVGLKNIHVGMTLGFVQTSKTPLLTPYLTYKLQLAENVDMFQVFSLIKLLEEEDPQLHIEYDKQNKSISFWLMGDIQIEILKNKIKERFKLDVDFIQGDVLYKETVLEPVEGVGHFEPLRHYAEVHVLLEPLPISSGIVVENKCSNDFLTTSYQRLIISHLKEKEHLGVLIGAPITDVKITLISGKAHLKHTEGGDFREATYRAVRQGLKMTKCQLLEPFYQFTLIVPEENLGKAIFDLEQMKAEFNLSTTSEYATITGEAPVSLMQNYYKNVAMYTKGKGQFLCSLSGFKPCHNEQEVILNKHYDSESDLENPTGSVFCQKGAGFYVKYSDVYDYMHIPLSNKQPTKDKSIIKEKQYSHLDDELMDIFEKTYGKIKEQRFKPVIKQKEKSLEKVQLKKDCLLVDGYNVIYSWDELKEIAKENLDYARTRLVDILSNYQGYRNCELIVVFDAYKVKGNLGTIEKNGNISIVYTKESQTADMYIERVTKTLAQSYNVIVATSDGLEQIIVMSQGARRMSSRELKLEIEYLTKTQLSEFQNKLPAHNQNYVLNNQN